jgi:hypothetical protein
MHSSMINTEQLIHEGDVNTQHIMMLIDKGIKLNIRSNRTPGAQLARKIYRLLLPLKTLCFLLLVTLSFFEYPQWCYKNETLIKSSCEIDSSDETM